MFGSSMGLCSEGGKHTRAHAGMIPFELSNVLLRSVDGQVGKMPYGYISLESTWAVRHP